ncbi:MAG: fibronectin type III domain-containing protein [Solirubrobacteraceae bacterium]
MSMNLVLSTARRTCMTAAATLTLVATCGSAAASARALVLPHAASPQAGSSERGLLGAHLTAQASTPAAVTGLTVSSTAPETVSWNPPADTGGAPLTGYLVSATNLTTPASAPQTATTTATTFTFTNLTFGDTYTYTVTAENTAGQGAPATSARVMVAADTAQLDTTLQPLLKPTGARSSVSAIARHHGFTFSYTALESGTLSVQWYRQVKVHKRWIFHPVGLAIVHVTHAGKIKVPLKLTSYGRRLLRAGKRLRLNQAEQFENPAAPQLDGLLAQALELR